MSYWHDINFNDLSLIFYWKKYEQKYYPSFGLNSFIIICVFFYVIGCPIIKLAIELYRIKMSFLRRKFEAVIIKNLLVRKRHWYWTLIEILCPLVIFAIFIYFQCTKLYGGKVTLNKHMSEKNIIEKFTFGNEDSINVAYAPATPFTIEFMKQFNSTKLILHLRKTKRLGK